MFPKTLLQESPSCFFLTIAFHISSLYDYDVEVDLNILLKITGGLNNLRFSWNRDAQCAVYHLGVKDGYLGFLSPRIPPSDSPDGWQEVRDLPNLSPKARRTETGFIERVLGWGRQVVLLWWSRFVLYIYLCSRLILWFIMIYPLCISSVRVCLQWFIVVACMNMLDVYGKSLDVTCSKPP